MARLPRERSKAHKMLSKHYFKPGNKEMMRKMTNAKSPPPFAQGYWKVT